MIATSATPVKGFRVVLRPARGTDEAKAFAKYLNAVIVAGAGQSFTATESKKFPGLVMRQLGHRFSFSYDRPGRPLEVAYVIWGDIAVQTEHYGTHFASFPPAVQDHIDATLAAYAAKLKKAAA